MFGTGKPKLVSFSRLDQNDEQQNAAKDEALLDAKKAKDVDENKYKKEENKLNTWHALVIGSWCLCVFFLVVYMDQRLPDPLTLRDAD